MRREITLLEALIAILVAPFYVVYWIVSRTLAWIFLIGLFIETREETCDFSRGRNRA